LEDNLHKILCGLLELDLVYGRVAVPIPRAADAVTRIEDLMELRGFSSVVDTKTLKSECKELEEFRDKLAHGTWARFPGHKIPILQITSGKNPDGSKARINPKGGAITLPVMKSYAKGIEDAIRDIRRLAKELASQHAASRRNLRS
jgi:hypothetical protein